MAEDKINIIDETKKDLQTLWKFVASNILWCAIILGGLIYLGFSAGNIQFFVSIIALEALAVGLSQIGQFIYTRRNFNNDNTNNLGLIWLGVHVLVGICCMGIYFTKVTPLPLP